MATTKKNAGKKPTLAQQLAAAKKEIGRLEGLNIEQGKQLGASESTISGLRADLQLRDEALAGVRSTNAALRQENDKFRNETIPKTVKDAVDYLLTQADTVPEAVMIELGRFIEMAKSKALGKFGPFVAAFEAFTKTLTKKK